MTRGENSLQINKETFLSLLLVSLKRERETTGKNEKPVTMQISKRFFLCLPPLNLAQSSIGMRREISIRMENLWRKVFLVIYLFFMKYSFIIMKMFFIDSRVSFIEFIFGEGAFIASNCGAKECLETSRERRFGLMFRNIVAIENSLNLKSFRKKLNFVDISCQSCYKALRK